jgi:hypothetical protein
MSTQQELITIHEGLIDLSESYEFLSRNILELQGLQSNLIADLNIKLTALLERANALVN